MRLFQKTVLYTFSLIILSASIPVLANEIISASDPAIQYQGRWDRSQYGTARTGRGAVYMKANFTGTLLAVDLKDTHAWWEYSIDNSPMKHFKAKESTTVLAPSLPAGNHQVLLVRDTEGENGISEINGFILSDNATMISPTKPTNRRIEVLGDSITAGAWNKGLGDYVDQENGYMAFGPILARMLNAEWSIVAKSGEGVVRNYSEPLGLPGHIIRAKEDYVRTFYTQEEPKWDFKIDPPQAILIAYGTNDFVDKHNLPKMEDFGMEYVRLINTVRSHNPSATIICLEPVPSWLSPDVRNTIRAIVKSKRDRGDKKLYYIGLNEERPLLEAADFADGNTHPLIKGDEKIASYLKDKIAKIMNW
jgi:lysophospholipase L1-like esterase